MGKASVALLAAAGAMVLTSSPARACTLVCGPARKQSATELRAAFDARPIVVLGRVREVVRATHPADLDEKYADRVAILDVIREWKGAGQATYRLRTCCCDVCCGYPFEVGQVHLLFLARDGESISGGCPDPPKDYIRADIRRLDKITGRRSLSMPAELR